MSLSSLTFEKTAHHTARIVRVRTAVLVTLFVAGCFDPMDAPDQSQFAELESLAELDEPLVRLYAAPVNPGLAILSSHPWFVTKQANENMFQR